jgi:hypothetical protein
MSTAETFITAPIVQVGFALQSSEQMMVSYQQPA